MTQLVKELQPMRSAENPITVDPNDRFSQPPPSLAAVAYSRMAFGLTPTFIDEFNALGATDAARLQAYIDQQLDPDSIDDSDCDARIAQANYITINLSRSLMWKRYQRRLCPEPGDPDFDDHPSCVDGDINRNLPRQELERLTFMRAVYSKRQLHEVLVSFWHDHFSVYAQADVVRSNIMQYDRDCIRPFVLGNFRTMLEETAKSTSMLYYLDNYTSSVAGPNENYARELLELHTMGEEHYLGSGILSYQVEKDANGWPVGYVDGDVYEASRCFTGWTIDNNAGQNNDSGN